MTIVSAGRKPLEEMLSESRVRENLTHGLMRGRWKPSIFRVKGATILLYKNAFFLRQSKDKVFLTYC